ncbi:MAG: hypothetical protein R8K53_09695 [Mariprofundaceae bacterium]
MLLIILPILLIAQPLPLLAGDENSAVYAEPVAHIESIADTEPLANTERLTHKERLAHKEPTTTPLIKTASTSKTTAKATINAEIPMPTSAAEQAESSQASDLPTFDMDVLIKRVKKTDAIGVFSKLALRSDALDLIGLVKAWQRHVKHLTLDEVRSQYDGLLLKILALLNDDPVLSHDINLAREKIWQSLLEVKT